jgi:hypothetical protein
VDYQVGREISKMSDASICPAGGDFPHPAHCDERCPRLRARPVDLLFADAEPATHFVGFRGEEYHSAVAVWGQPDFYHRTWDRRATQEVAPTDVVVFARYHDREPTKFSFDDSNQPDDPAAEERK